MHFTEDDFENAILELFREQLGYDYVYGPNVMRDYAEPLYVEVLEAVLPQINRGLPQAAIDEAKNSPFLKGTYVDTGFPSVFSSCFAYDSFGISTSE